MSKKIYSIAISPNRDTVTEDDLRDYYKIAHAYLEKNTSRYVAVFEKGSRDFYNHIQIVCETTLADTSIRDYLNNHYKNFKGFYKGKRGIKDGSTVTLVNRTKNGEVMFAYPMKESEKLVCDIKGISEQEMQHFVEEFAKLPDYKAAAKKALEVRTNKQRRDSFKNATNAATLIWKRIPTRQAEEEVYLERMKRTGKRYNEVHTVYDSKKNIWVKQKEAKYEMAGTEVRKIPREHGEVPNVRDYASKPKQIKQIFLDIGWEQQSTEMWRQYKNNVDVIIDILKRWEINREEEIIKNRNEDIVEIEEEDPESTLGVVLSDNEDDASEFVEES